MPFPTILVTFFDGSQRTVSRDTLVLDWQAVPDIGIQSIRFLPDEATQLYGDRFWAYLEGPNAFVVGARKPAQDVGTPGATFETLTELVFTRQGQMTVREPATIPLAATVKRWIYG